MTLFDSHAHYWDEKLKDDAATLVPTFLASGGVGIVNVGTSPETSRLAAEQARKETVKKVLTIVGIAAVVVLAAFIGIRAALKKRQQPQQRRTPKSVPRSQQAQERHATRGGGGYKPKH